MNTKRKANGKAVAATVPRAENFDTVRDLEAQIRQAWEAWEGSKKGATPRGNNKQGEVRPGDPACQRRILQVQQKLAKLLRLDLSERHEDGPVASVSTTNARAKMNAALDLQRRELWAAWEGSKQGHCGDPAYMELLLDVSDRKAKLLGLYRQAPGLGRSTRHLGL